jgi:hypothetical protein
MVMKFMLLPWKPELVFTGLSIMGVNPQNLKFNSHVVNTLAYQAKTRLVWFASGRHKTLCSVPLFGTTLR